MEIKDVVVTPISIRSKGGGTPNTWGVQVGTSAAIVRVYTDTGLVGIGEAMHADLSTFIIEHKFKRLMIGEDPTNVGRLMAKLEGLSGARWQMRTYVHSMAAVEMALWDVLGKVTGQPVSTLLGGKVRDRVEWAALQWIYPAEVMAEKARECVNQGFKTLKLRVGLNPKRDIENVAAVRDAVGKDVKIRVDANQAWTPGFAVKMISELEKYDLEYVEQPVLLEDVKGMAEVRKRVNVPIAANEAAWTLFEAINIIREEAADVLLVDPRCAGGLMACKKIAGIAEAAGIPVVTHASGEFGISFTAIMHLIASTPNFLYANDEGYLRHEDDLIREPITFADGFTVVPDAPGLGVTIDEHKLELYAAEYQKQGEYFFVTKAGPQGEFPKAPRY